MNNDEVQKIIYAVSKELEVNYNKYKTKKYGIAERTLIPFATIESSTKVIRSEGTDEDNDVMICYDENGWFIYDSTVQVGAGVQKVIKENITEVSQEEVSRQYQKLNLIEKMEFISTAYDIIKYSENKTYLF